MAATASSSVELADMATYLRVGSMAIGAYDFLLTIPAAYRIWQTQRRAGHIIVSFALFISIRYISVTAVAIGNVGWFGVMSHARCSWWFLMSPIFKVLQAMVAHLILAWRTYNLAQRSRIIGWTLAILYTCVITVEWVSNIYGREPAIDSDGRHCRAVNPQRHYGSWIFYVTALAYDSTVTVISLIYLLRYKFSKTSTVMGRITKIMLRDGLGYFILISVANVFNIVLYPTDEYTQSAGVTLTYVLTWIASQRLLIHMHDVRINRQNDTMDTVATYTRSNDSSQAVSRALRSQFESRKEDDKWTDPDLDDANSMAERGERISVHVRIERTVEVQDMPRVPVAFRSRRPVSSMWTSQGTFSAASREHHEPNALMRTIRP